MIKVFRHYVPRMSVFLGAGEAALFLTLIVIFLSVAFPGHYDEFFRTPFVSPDAIVFASWIVVVMTLMMGATGLYNRDVMFEFDAVLARIALSSSMAFAIVLCIGLLLPYWGLSYSEHYKSAAAAIAICAIASVVVRVGFANFAKVENLKRRLLIVGRGRSAAKIAQMSVADRYRFNVVGYVDCGDDLQRSPLLPFFPGTSFATPEAALALVRTHSVDGLIVASDERRGLPHSALLRCRMEGISIEDFSTFWESHSGHVDLESLQPSWFTYGDGFSMNRDRLIAKSCFDYLVATMLLVATSPIMLLTALAIKTTSPGPVLFRQERVGRNGKIFGVLKFRSMAVDAEKAGPQWAKVNDARVTRVGRFIRQVRIDELPQVINILKGDMSFVGPRPERPHFVAQLSEVIPYFDERHRVKPGLSGWAQINYPYGASIDDARNKLSYDLYYLKNGTIFLDFLILLRTVHVVLWPFGAR